MKNKTFMAAAATAAIVISPVLAMAQSTSTNSGAPHRVCLPILQQLVNDFNNANSARSAMERVKLLIKNRCTENAGTDNLTVSARTGSAPLTVTFTAQIPSGQPAGTTYMLAYGDGSSESINATPGTYTRTHVYAANGTFKAQLTASAPNADAHVIGRANIFVGPIVPTSAPVLKRIVAPAYLKVGHQGTWRVADAIASGDTTFTVNWGDGTSSTGNASSTVNRGVFQHTYAATGTYTVHFTATNSQGSTSANYPVIVVATKAKAKKNQ